MDYGVKENGFDLVHVREKRTGKERRGDNVR